MKVTPEDLCGLADTCLAESRDINTGWSAEASGLQVDSGAAGNSPMGPGFVSAHTATVDSGDVALGRLAAVLESDMDDLYACAFDITTQDEESARVSRALDTEVSSSPLVRLALGLG